jgi:hypothetical protein
MTPFSPTLKEMSPADRVMTLENTMQVDKYSIHFLMGWGVPYVKYHSVASAARFEDIGLVDRYRKDAWNGA